MKNFLSVEDVQSINELVQKALAFKIDPLSNKTQGSGKRSVAIDLRHAERGRVARLFQTPGPARIADHQALSALCDVLSRRLRIGRDGLTL